MIPSILANFPPNTHSLTLVSDPDGLLSGEQILVELNQRGFTIIQEIDPVVLRHRIEGVRPFNQERPVIVVTTGALESLPYDLYESGHWISLALHQYFLNLAYPVVRTLNVAQLEKLSSRQQPSVTIGRRKTSEFILKQVFDLELESLVHPAYFVDWLVRFHRELAPLPDEVKAVFIEYLRRLPMYKDWKVSALLEDKQSLTDFLQSQWGYYVQTSTGMSLGEASGEYVLVFERDTSLQDLLPGLLRQRVLNPMPVDEIRIIPEWARMGVVNTEETQIDKHRRQVAVLIQSIYDQIFQQDHKGTIEFMKGFSWKQCQNLALDWADLTSLIYQPEYTLDAELLSNYAKLIRLVDEGFLGWINGHYTPLAAQRLPEPKHVYHIPDYLAYLRSTGEFQKLALVILDGMSLMDWRVIQPIWSIKNPAWSIQMSILLAQIPTVTQISRYGIISGLRPAEHITDLDRSPVERNLWRAFWTRAGLSDRSVDLQPLALDRMSRPPEVENFRVDTLCLIDDTLDRFSHNASLGTVDQLSSLLLWLQPNVETNSKPLELLIEDLLHREFTVFLASDHGHVEAIGFGSPSEGLLAQTRGKRARLYNDRRAAERVQIAFPETVLWGEDGLLPKGLFALMPRNRAAFAPAGEKVVTHGGLAIDEAIVPFVRINLQKA
jgi:hypothetical protein